MTSKIFYMRTPNGYSIFYTLLHWVLRILPVSSLLPLFARSNNTGLNASRNMTKTRQHLASTWICSRSKTNHFHCYSRYSLEWIQIKMRLRRLRDCCNSLPYAQQQYHQNHQQPPICHLMCQVRQRQEKLWFQLYQVLLQEIRITRTLLFNL